MILTPEEIEEGAKRLAKATGKNWTELTAKEQAGFAMVVVNLAAAGPLATVSHSPEAVHVFLTWMGDPVQ